MLIYVTFICNDILFQDNTTIIFTRVTIYLQ